LLLFSVNETYTLLGNLGIFLKLRKFL